MHHLFVRYQQQSGSTFIVQLFVVNFNFSFSISSGSWLDIINSSTATSPAHWQKLQDPPRIVTFMIRQPISEVDVLYATSHWLIKNDWQIETISFPRGQEINSADQQQFFKDCFESDACTLPDTVKFQTNGPDIIASKGTRKWKIECKGYSNATSQTLRNNFDRALASCVTYFDDNINLQLGLAMPDHYKLDVQKRIPIALRTALKLSIFLYNTTTQTVDLFEPDIKVLMK